MTLEEQREMANEGSSYNESSSLSDSSWIFWLIFGITFIPGLGIFTASMVYFFKVRKINNARTMRWLPEQNE